MHILTTLLFALSLLLAIAAEPHLPSSATRRRHFGNVPERNATAHRLQKRFDNARFSFYDAGLGSCGKVNSASDFIVALNSAQYDSGSYCFQMITISYGGKTTQAQITDRCPGCPVDGLDFSRGLFDYFSSESAGIIYGTWSFGSGAPSPSPSPSPSPKPTPTSTWQAPSSTPATTSWSSSTSPSPSSSTTTTSSALYTTHASSTSSTLSSTTSSTMTSDVTVETAGALTDTEAGNVLSQLNLAVVGMAGIITYGSKAI